MIAHDQHGFDVRLDWGLSGLRSLLDGGVRTIVVVDVLRFTTAVDVACGRGAAVTPHPWDDDGTAAAEAGRLGATLATRHATNGDVTVPSLSPVSLRRLGTSDHVLLPSPNGSALAVAAAAGGVEVLAGCLRNASAVAGAIRGFPVGVVAAGERWPDGSLRPAIEDGWGAGAVVRALGPPAGAPSGFLALLAGSLPGPDETLVEDQGGPGPDPVRSASPEATAMAAALPADLASALPQTASGRELTTAGWSLDVEVAAALDVSQTVPRLDRGTFRAA